MPNNITSENGFILPKTDKIYTEIEYEENPKGVTRVLARNIGARSFEFRVNVNCRQLEDIIKSCEKSNMKQDVILSQNEQDIASLTEQVNSLTTIVKSLRHEKVVLVEKVEGLEAEKKQLKADIVALEKGSKLADEAELIENPESTSSKEEIKFSELQSAVKEQMDKGLDSAAIAEILQKPESTIKQSIAVINKKLDETGSVNG